MNGTTDGLRPEAPVIMRYDMGGATLLIIDGPPLRSDGGLLIIPYLQIPADAPQRGWQGAELFVLDDDVP
jgi:hypothetical protein